MDIQNVQGTWLFVQVLSKVQLKGSFLILVQTFISRCQPRKQCCVILFLHC